MLMAPLSSGATAQATQMTEIQSDQLSNQILIHTDSRQYYSGEEVTGKVILTLAEPLEIDSLNLKLSGYEHAEFQFKDTRTVDSVGPNGTVTTTTVSGTNFANGTNTIYGREYVLFDCHSTLEAGVYTFPFKLRLKENIPGTFWYRKDGLESQAEVDYQITAAVKSHLTSELQCSTGLVIAQPVKEEIMSAETYQEAKVSFMYCIPRGQVSLSAAIDKTAYSPGDPVMLSLIVDNSKSNVDLPRFSFKLERTISLVAEGKTHYRTNIVAKNQIEGVPKGDKAERIMTVNLPIDTETSTDGQLIKCYYELVVELQVPWSPKIKTTTPVRVFARPLSEYSTLLAWPQGWESKTMPVIDLTNLPFESI